MNNLSKLEWGRQFVRAYHPVATYFIVGRVCELLGSIPCTMYLEQITNVVCYSHEYIEPLCGQMVNLLAFYSNDPSSNLA